MRGSNTELVNVIVHTVSTVFVGPKRSECENEHSSHLPAKNARGTKISLLHTSSRHGA